ncbi:MAG TPA: DNA repair protein RecO [Anaerolineales bacterium]|nr:DNA repair protein RecO [Anaerolineales bacterium]HNA89069.1 DNA repair protein RecO [Anaerolineales bacterium]HNB35315.1 DNA repair protein RecO [Anaerolineales bacterium]HNC09510.1 DNA repair protein RecO [Anaerolineales bacterium]
MTDFRSFRASAVVLRHTDWGEADRLLTLYTRDQGIVRALAKGARKVTSRKAGHLQPFTHITVQLAKGRDLLIVTQVETVNAFLPLHDDLVKTGYAAYVVELLLRFSYEEEGADPSIFRLLVDTLDRIEKEEDAWMATRYYEVRLLDAVGFRPQLFECVNCGREIMAEDQFFSFTSGGVICPRCGEGIPNLTKISLEALKYLRHFQRSSYKEASRARPGPDIQKEAEMLMQGYFTHLLERTLNTPGFIRKIKP